MDGGGCAGFTYKFELADSQAEDDTVAETDGVSLEFKDEMSQAVMKPVGVEGYDYTYVIMPMRV